MSAAIRDAAIKLAASLNDFLAETDSTRLTHKPERVEQFIKESLHYCPGRSIPFRDVYASFIDWLPAAERLAWNRKRFAQSLPPYAPSGPHSANITIAGNVSATPAEGDGTTFVKLAGRLKRVPRK